VISPPTGVSQGGKLNMRSFTLCAVLLLLSLALACESDKKSDETPAPGVEKAAEPDYITVQHILIGFQGSVPGKNITRTRAEAQKLAEDVFARAKAGEDFDALVKEYTDDSYPGRYRMANFGVPADMSQRVYARDRMVAAFGDVGFPLAVGEIGLAEFDPEKSPYGWHIIKRVE
jgi:parvulin-like peptidyl-prolyl isomerase